MRGSQPKVNQQQLAEILAIGERRRLARRALSAKALAYQYGTSINRMMRYLHNPATCEIEELRQLIERNKRIVAATDPAGISARYGVHQVTLHNWWRGRFAKRFGGMGGY